ncbi:hypothetical protein AB0H36_34600 [Kribbella sp. NPDC050820]
MSEWFALRPVHEPKSREPEIRRRPPPEPDPEPVPAEEAADDE